MNLTFVVYKYPTSVYENTVTFLCSVDSHAEGPLANNGLEVDKLSDDGCRSCAPVLAGRAFNHAVNFAYTTANQQQRLRREGYINTTRYGHDGLGRSSVC